MRVEWRHYYQEQNNFSLDSDRYEVRFVGASEGVETDELGPYDVVRATIDTTDIRAAKFVIGESYPNPHPKWLEVKEVWRQSETPEAIRKAMDLAGPEKDRAVAVVKDPMQRIKAIFEAMDAEKLVERVIGLEEELERRTEIWQGWKDAWWKRHQAEIDRVVGQLERFSAAANERIEALEVPLDTTNCDTLLRLQTDLTGVDSKIEKLWDFHDELDKKVQKRAVAAWVSNRIEEVRERANERIEEVWRKVNSQSDPWPKLARLSGRLDEVEKHIRKGLKAAEEPLKKERRPEELEKRIKAFQDWACHPNKRRDLYMDMAHKVEQIFQVDWASKAAWIRYLVSGERDLAEGDRERIGLEDENAE